MEIVCRVNTNIRDYTAVISVDEYFTKLLNKEDFDWWLFNTSYRPDIVAVSKKKPILYMGCSFTYGMGLSEQETVSARTAKLTHRTVYNRAGSGWGLDQLLYQLRRDDFYKDIKEPEYLIYIFLTDHLYRLDKFKIIDADGAFQPKFKLKRGTLVEEKPHFWHYLYFVEKIMYNYRYKWNHYKNDDEAFDRMKPYFIQSKAAMEKHWKNTKFVIVKFPTSMEEAVLYIARWKELEDEGFIIIDVADLSREPFWEERWRCDGWHPSAEVWKILVPKILKQLHI